jgi:hypothetical protein
MLDSRAYLFVATDTGGAAVRNSSGDFTGEEMGKEENGRRKGYFNLWRFYSYRPYSHIYT